ncbi:MAG: hypothetical protein JXA11_11815 [Phycisphaerae bacterium]|nr:hypothetical protein [Phycisphaerae bacterium]
MPDNTMNPAKKELHHLLCPAYAGDWDALNVAFHTDAALEDSRARVESAPGKLTVTGRTPVDVLHSLYSWLEELGFLFTVNGPVAPDATIQELPTLTRTYQPYLKRRGIRQHINFPMDISSYPLAEAKEYLRNLARMRFNAITFHQYLACGWFHMDLPEIGDSFVDRKGRIHDYTFFYSEYHPVPEEPYIQAVVRNEHTFCPPEGESRYGTKEARSFAYRFLGELIREAKRYGLYVSVSTDIAGSNFKDYFPNAKSYDRGLWVKATLEMLNQMTALYGDADDFELISPENVSRESDDWEGECRAFLARLLPDWSKEKVDELIASANVDSDYEKGGFLQTLECVDVALEAFRRAKESKEIAPRLTGKKLSVGLYNGMAGISEPNARVLTAAVPEEYGLAWLPGHGAHTCHLRVESKKLPPADRARLRMYSWVEIDGFMYTPQFPRTGLKENIDFCVNAGDPRQSRGVLFNHWRNAENELGLLYASLASYADLSPADFGPKVLKPYWGVRDEALLEEFLQAMEAVDRLQPKCGFCYLACWWDVDPNKDMFPMTNNITEEETAEQLETTRKAVDLLDRLIAQSTRTAGLKSMRFQRATLQAGVEHIQAALKVKRMADYLKTVDRTNLTAEQRNQFQALGDEALADAEKWLHIMASNCVDRGVEGNIVSYHHVMVGYIKGFQGLYGTIQYEPMPEYGVPSSIQAPPPLI